MKSQLCTPTVSQKHYISYLQQETLRGGPKKRKLSEEDKLIRILAGLPHQNNMEVDSGFNKNGIMEYVIRERSLHHRAIGNLLTRLEDSGNITKRPSKKHERGDFFYYKTDKGNELLNKIKEKRGLLLPEEDSL